MEQCESKSIKGVTSPRWNARWLPAMGLCLGCLASLGAPAWGQQSAADPASTATPKNPDAKAESTDTSFLSKVTFHGYLSQAYAKSDGNQILGIPKAGTLDYDTAALQVRADMTAADSFAVKFRHERNGLSPAQKTVPDVALDWVFYEHQFGDSAVRVGRVKVPLGIYNEVRDVGTILPFYRPARDFYGQGAYSTETVDGALVSHRFRLGSGWDLNGDVYYGNWNLFDSHQNEVKVSKSLGTQFFLETPVSGLRFGLGALRFDASANPTTPAAYWHDVHGSVQATFGRVEGEVEYQDETAELLSGKTLYGIKSGYARVGVHLTDKLMANGQYERFQLAIAALKKPTDYDKDEILGLSYRYRSDVVLKAEYHWNTGYFLDTPPSILGPVAKTQYGLLSLSASF
jgi:hypothetical protein